MCFVHRNGEEKKREIIAASNLGSWYKQEQQLPELFESENKGESTPKTNNNNSNNNNNNNNNFIQVSFW